MEKEASAFVPTKEVEEASKRAILDALNEQYEYRRRHTPWYRSYGGYWAEKEGFHGSVPAMQKPGYAQQMVNTYQRFPGLDRYRVGFEAGSSLGDLFLWIRDKLTK
jgi:hypothetical protein